MTPARNAALLRHRIMALVELHKLAGGGDAREPQDVAAILLQQCCSGDSAGDAFAAFAAFAFAFTFTFAAAAAAAGGGGGGEGHGDGWRLRCVRM